MVDHDDDEQELKEEHHRERDEVGGVVIETFDDERPEITDSQLSRIFKLNIGASIFQILTGIAIILLLDSDKKYAWYSNFPLLDEDAQGNPFDQGPDPNRLFAFSTGYLAGPFLLLSGLDHLLVCTCFKKIYESGLRSNYNVFRWIEYAVSASVMRILVALLSGISDIHTLFLIFGLTACTMLFGLVFELENRDRSLGQVKWYSFWIGFVPHTFAWSVIFCFFFRNASQSNPPAFVWAIIVIVFTLDLTFAITLFLQWRGRGAWKNYIRGEFAFIILSFTSKQLLAWINFQGGNR